MRTTAVALALLLGSAVGGWAQDAPKAEIGTSLGVTVSIPESGSNLTSIGVPGAGTLLGAPVLYLTLFPSRSVMIEPQVSFQVLSINSRSVTNTSLMGQLGYLFTPENSGSPYIAGHVGFFRASDRTSVTSRAYGAAFGYRSVVSSGAAIRFEARYRQWSGDFIDNVGELTLSLGVGGVFS